MEGVLKLTGSGLEAPLNDYVAGLKQGLEEVGRGVRLERVWYRMDWFGSAFRSIQAKPTVRREESERVLTRVKRSIVQPAAGRSFAVLYNSASVINLNKPDRDWSGTGKEGGRGLNETVDRYELNEQGG